ncbi:hypothetical protein RF11_12349 [Thelohanellus kitauei]|uniref:Uncharacterized protein n=1 Tax=Thelohanellus kitauei TaxID=669202 RepID=A0A0C2JU11_THEKT|nr:hypothetical protein RF11_12349 [Thelohanellus kitauei]
MVNEIIATVNLVMFKTQILTGAIIRPPMLSVRMIDPGLIYMDIKVFIVSFVRSGSSTTFFFLEPVQFLRELTLRQLDDLCGICFFITLFHRLPLRFQRHQ